MSKFLATRFAWRYLVSRKSHSAVGTISIVSLCGMAVATAAIICVMSVFNGFHAMIADRLDMLSPELVIVPAKGKTITAADSLADAIRRMPQIRLASVTLADNALALYDGKEFPITVKGVDMETYRRVTNLDSLIIASDQNREETPADQNREETSTDQHRDEASSTPASLSIGVASSLGVMPGESMMVFTPRRIGRVNLSNPASSFITDSVRVTEVFRSNQAQYDENLIFVDLDMARNLLQYDTDGSAIEISLTPGSDSDAVRTQLQSAIGEQYRVLDRLMQQSDSFKMINIEKWVTFLLLFFILIIASFNIISSLSMIVLEKEKSLTTLRALGLSSNKIGGIFFRQSILVSAIGGAVGIAMGVTLVLLQQEFGLIKIAGDPSQLVMTSYPVRLDPADILITVLPIGLIAIATGWITAAFAKARLRTI